MHEPKAPRDPLLGTICHDLRDPLASIMMGSTFLLKHSEEGKPRRMVEAIKRSAERMNRIIDDFHDLTLLDRGDLDIAPESLDVESLLDHVTESLAPLLREHDARLEIGAPSESIVVRADRSRFVQLFEKLVRNALDASGPGAIVTLRAEPGIDRIVFRIVDRGAGIDASIVPHLFDWRFLTTRKSRKGAGLGLGIARGLAVAQGGDLRLETTGAAGTTFVVEMPRGGA